VKTVGVGSEKHDVGVSANGGMEEERENEDVSRSEKGSTSAPAGNTANHASPTKSTPPQQQPPTTSNNNNNKNNISNNSNSESVLEKKQQKAPRNPSLTPTPTTTATTTTAPTAAAATQSRTPNAAPSATRGCVGAAAGGGGGVGTKESAGEEDGDESDAEIQRVKAELEQLEKSVDPKDLGDLRGTTSALSRKMTTEEHAMMLYKRKLRNRLSAARSRKRHQQTLLQLQSQIDGLNELSNRVMESCEACSVDNGRLREENMRLYCENMNLRTHLAAVNGATAPPSENNNSSNTQQHLAQSHTAQQQQQQHAVAMAMFAGVHGPPQSVPPMYGAMAAGAVAPQHLQQQIHVLQNQAALAAAVHHHNHLPQQQPRVSPALAQSTPAAAGAAAPAAKPLPAAHEHEQRHHSNHQPHHQHVAPAMSQHQQRTPRAGSDSGENRAPAARATETT